jgi:hypothetical protein
MTPRTTVARATVRAGLRVTSSASISIAGSPLIVMDVPPSTKFFPVRIRFTLCPAFPEAGPAAVSAGTALLTVKGRVLLDRSTPPGLVVTVTVRGPAAVPAGISKVALMDEELMTSTTGSTANPLMATAVLPSTKFLPVKVSTTGAEAFPEDGETAVSTGAMLLTTKGRDVLVRSTPKTVVFTVTLFDPGTAAAGMVKVALTAPELRKSIVGVTPRSPMVTDVPPLTKFLPLRTMTICAPGAPDIGDMRVSAGTILLMAKGRALLVRGVPFTVVVTVIFRTPAAASPGTVNVALMDVELMNCTTGVTASPLIATDVAPLTKFVPFKVSVAAAPGDAAAGVTLVSVGVRLKILNGRAGLVPRGVVTLIVRLPATASDATVNVALAVVLLSTVRDEDVRPLPVTLIDVWPGMKFRPDSVTSTGCAALPKLGVIPVTTGGAVTGGGACAVTCTVNSIAKMKPADILREIQ